MIYYEKLCNSFCCFVLFGLICNAALAESNEIKELSLDELFASLKIETDESRARKLEDKIWRSWLSAENDEIDGLMNDAYYFRREFNLSSAIESLEEVISKAQNYSEAWNQLVIANFYKGDYASAISYIEKH